MELKSFFLQLICIFNSLTFCSFYFGNCGSMSLASFPRLIVRGRKKKRKEKTFWKYASKDHFKYKERVYNLNEQPLYRVTTFANRYCYGNCIVFKFHQKHSSLGNFPKRKKKYYFEKVFFWILNVKMYKIVFILKRKERNRKMVKSDICCLW